MSLIWAKKGSKGLSLVIFWEEKKHNPFLHIGLEMDFLNKDGVLARGFELELNIALAKRATRRHLYLWALNILQLTTSGAHKRTIPRSKSHNEVCAPEDRLID